jgi:hypothetical protein
MKIRRASRQIIDEALNMISGVQKELSSGANLSGGDLKLEVVLISGAVELH